MAEKLTSEQTQQILTQRPDVAANKYYSANPGEWYSKHGKKEGFSFTGNSSTPAAPASATQTSPYGTTYLSPQMSSYSAAPAQYNPTQFTFDANQYMPSIQAQANSIYQPQQAQLEALKGLSTAQYEQNKVQTEEDFQKRMKQEVEAINQRGAFFGGGAIANEQGIRTEQSRAMNTLSLQQQASQADLLAKQGMLSAEQANYIKDQLYNSESGAYGRFKDTQNLQFQNYQTQLNQYNAERNYGMDVAQFNQGLQQQQIANQQWQKSYEFQLLSKQMDTELERQKMKLDYGITSANLKLAQDRFQEEINQFGDTNSLGWASLLEKNKGASDTQWEDSLNRFSSASNSMFNQRETSGYVSPHNYNQTLEEWMKSGGTVGDFYSQFQFFVDPNLKSQYNTVKKSSQTAQGD